MTNTKPGCNGSQRAATDQHVPNAGYVLLCEFCLRMSAADLAGWNIATPLAAHVPHIVRVSSKQKVVWINARWVVTSVQDVQPVWYRAMRVRIREPMGKELLCFPIYPEGNHPIALIVFTPSKLYAFA